MDLSSCSHTDYRFSDDKSDQMSCWLFLKTSSYLFNFFLNYLKKPASWGGCRLKISRLFLWRN